MIVAALGQQSIKTARRDACSTDLEPKMREVAGAFENAHE